MKRGLSALASAAILSGTLFMGAGAANAIVCPAGQGAMTMGSISECVPIGSGGGNGGAITYNGGGQINNPAPAPIQVPAYNAPQWTPPAYTPPPVYVPAPQAPAPAAPHLEAPAAPQAPTVTGGSDAGGYMGYHAPAAGQAPVFTAPSGVAVTKNDQGVWVDPNTGLAADPGVAAQAEQAAAAPAAEAKTPEAAAQEQAAQAAQQLQAKAAEIKKAADLAIARVQIEAAVTKALDNALARH